MHAYKTLQFQDLKKCNYSGRSPHGKLTRRMRARAEIINEVSKVQSILAYSP